MLYNKKVFSVVTDHIVLYSLKDSLKMSKFWLPLFKVYLSSFYKNYDIVLSVSKETEVEFIIDLKIKLFNYLYLLLVKKILTN